MYQSPTKEQIEAQQKNLPEREGGIRIFQADKARSGHSSPVLRSGQLDGNLVVYEAEVKKVDDNEDFLFQQLDRVRQQRETRQ